MKSTKSDPVLPTLAAKVKSVLARTAQLGELRPIESFDGLSDMLAGAFPESDRVKMSCCDNPSCSGDCERASGLDQMLKDLHNNGASFRLALVESREHIELLILADRIRREWKRLESSASVIRTLKDSLITATPADAASSQEYITKELRIVNRMIAELYQRVTELNARLETPLDQVGEEIADFDFESALEDAPADTASSAS